MEWSRRAVCLGALAAPVAVRAKEARPIDEQGFARIGGVDQWIGMRGESSANPAVLFLHGGPADVQSPYLDLFAPWERRFTIVHWDQRGAGLTFGRNGPTTPDVTLDRIVSDTIEVADEVRHRLGKRKVILVGHSWGALVGVHALKRGPDRFSAYVGTGQVVTWRQTVAGEYAFVLARARADSDAKAVAALEALGDPATFDFGKMNAVRQRLNGYLPATDTAYLEMQRQRARQAADPAAVKTVNDGVFFSVPRLLPALMAADLPALGYDMPTPFFVFQGREDHITPVDVALEYARLVRAPRSGAETLSGGHFAVFTNPAAFVDLMDHKVRALAL
jgi:pimeloyl-ACP methyl ester carboxylesterase